jgi:hypothetical protein
MLAIALASLAVYSAIAWLSRQFVFGEGHAERPIVAVLGLLGVAFTLYLTALALAVRLPQDRRLLWWIIAPAILFRLVLLFSQPIQEIDIYRYLWDGAVSRAGISPFRYSPKQVREAMPGAGLPDDLRRLVDLRTSSPPLATILARVHCEELPTIYPPVSQLVFHGVAWITPQAASVETRVVLMKAVLLGFDLATLGLVIALLRFTGRHVGWSLAYAWCPLLLKEVANSGHLDAIAVFLCTLAIYLGVRGLHTNPKRQRGTVTSSLALRVSVGRVLREPASTHSRTWLIVAGAFTLGLAVGAKLYPFVLAPWLAVACVRRLGWGRAALAGAMFAATVAITLWPMFPQKPAAAMRTGAQDPSLGLVTFFRRWEMNDFVFRIVLENLLPQTGAPGELQPWFAVTPNAWRSAVCSLAVRYAGVEPWEAAFFAARVATSMAFLLVALVLACKASCCGPDDWLRAGFLTIAWFWLLSPTQNPWYWTWALPLLPFARSRAWLAVSGLVLLYYVRFWLQYHWPPPQAPLPGTALPGEWFFDFVVVWIEFVPLLAWLAVEVVVRRLKYGTTAAPTAAGQIATRVA